MGVAGDFGDLAYASGTLYRVAGRGNNSLYTIDPATGAATLAGAHGIDDMFGLPSANSPVGFRETTAQKNS